MRSVSDSYKNYINTSLIRKPKSKVVIDSITYDGETYLTTYPKIEHHSETAAGSFPAATCDFEIFNRDGNLSLFGKEVTVYRGLEINGSVHWVQIGIFSAKDEDIKVNINKRTISFKGTDRTQRFEKPYGGKAKWQSGNRRIYQIANEICTRNGVPLYTSSFQMSNYLFPGIPPGLDFDGITDRQMISFLAELCGCIAIILPNGSLRMKSVTETNMTIDKTKYKSLSIGNPLGPINTISFGHADYEDAIVKMQDGINEETKIEWAINDNPLTSFTDAEVVNNLLTLVSNNYFGRTFIPFELSDFIDDYIYELNDGVTIQKKDGSTVSVAILDISNQSRIKSNFKASQQSPGKTDMSLAGGLKESVRKVRFTVDHMNQVIESLATNGAGLETKLTQTDEAIRALLTDETNGLQTQITATADGISSLTSKVDEMKIGSRNILIDSACFETRYTAPYYVTMGETAIGDEPSLPSGKYKRFTFTAESAADSRGFSFVAETTKPPIGSPQNIKPNTTYTLTFWAKIGSGEKALTRNGLASMGLSKTAVLTSPLVGNGTTLPLDGTWKNYRYTFKTGTGTANSSFQMSFYFPMEANEEITLYLSSLQLEESSVPSDWHKNDADLAAEFMSENDVAGLLDTSIGDYLTDYVKSSTVTSLETKYDTAFTQTNKAIALKADQTTVTTLVDTVGNHSTLISSNTAAIETKATQILSTVSDTYYLKTSATALESSLKNYADGVGSTVYASATSYIDQQADHIKLAVEKNIKVGAVNLLNNSECFEELTEGYYRSAKTSNRAIISEATVPSKKSSKYFYKCNSVGNEVGVEYQNSSTNKLLACDLSEIIPNEQYTFSFYAKGVGNTDGITLSRIYLLNFGANVNITWYTDLCDPLKLTSQWKRYRLTFSIDSAPTRFWIQCWHPGVLNRDYHLLLSSFKLERGGVMTDWQLNGQEYATSSEIELLQNAINLKVTSSDVASQIAASINMCIKTDQNGVVQSEINMTSNRFSVDSTNFKLTKAGVITATSGTIGGWTLTNGKMYSGGTSANPKTCVVQSASGGTYVFAAGGTSHSDYSDCPFRVSKTGYLYASNADITGKITATSGSFKGSVTATSGSFTGKITATSGTIGGLTITGGKMYAGGSNGVKTCVIQAASSGTNTVFAAGGGDHSDYSDCPFRVEKDGSMYSKKGTIGGWTIASDSLYGVTGYSGHGSYFGVYLYKDKLQVTSAGYTFDTSWYSVYSAGASQSGSSSDINVKNNISEYEESYETFFDNLKPCKYKYNFGTSGRFHTGFVAQEVVESLENAGLTTQDFAGVVHLESPDPNGCEWYLRRDEFVALNTWQIQRLKATVSELQAEISALKNRINTQGDMQND